MSAGFEIGNELWPGESGLAEASCCSSWTRLALLSTDELISVRTGSGPATLIFPARSIENWTSWPLLAVGGKPHRTLASSTIFPSCFFRAANRLDQSCSGWLALRFDAGVRGPERPLSDCVCSFEWLGDAIVDRITSPKKWLAELRVFSTDCFATKLAGKAVAHATGRFMEGLARLDWLHR